MLRYVIIIAIIAVFAVVVPRCNKDLSDKQASTTLKAYRVGAERGEASGQYNLGGMYYAGIGVKRDVKEALKWFLKAAEQGFVLAQRNVGVMYHSGAGGAKDARQAFKWYRKAADQRDSISQAEIGKMYANGDGVAQDDTSAYMWFSLSAATGDKTAIENLGILTKKMSPAQLAEGQRMISAWQESHKK